MLVAAASIVVVAVAVGVSVGVLVGVPVAVLVDVLCDNVGNSSYVRFSVVPAHRTSSGSTPARPQGRYRRRAGRLRDPRIRQPRPHRFPTVGTVMGGCRPSALRLPPAMARRLGAAHPIGLGPRSYTKGTSTSGRAGLMAAPSSPRSTCSSSPGTISPAEALKDEAPASAGNSRELRPPRRVAAEVLWITNHTCRCPSYGTPNLNCSSSVTSL